MKTALHRLLLLLLLALPWAAQAGDAADYAKASPAKQARLLESWAAAPAPERLELIEALRANRVAIDQNKTPFIEENGAYRALEGDAEPVGTPKKLRLNNRLRGLLNTALASHQLFAEDPAQRLAAAKRLQRSGKPEQLPLLQQRLEAEDDPAVREALTLTLANLQLTANDPAVRLAAVRLLGETGAPMARVRLENLLATWGISLILIQLVRVLFGAQNVEVANPAWLSGGLQVLPNLVLPYNRMVIIGFALFVVLLTWLLLNKTRLGLNVRAVTQNRNMAACCGVPTGRIDMMAFGLGSGIAGLGGVALSQIGNVGPDLGQSYIIDSFLVVVLGGVGQLAGSIFAAFGLGIANKILEPQIGAVLGKILILALIILFIQKRPQGLFALKGRVID
jgi:urea ABC transporter permease protein UrtB